MPVRDWLSQVWAFGDDGDDQISAVSLRIPVGLFGASLLVLIAPAAWGIQLAVGKLLWTPTLFAIGFPIAFAAYYLVWKNVVSRLNAILGIG